MPNFVDYYEYSKLAAAAYVNLNPGDLKGASIVTNVVGREMLPRNLANQTFNPSGGSGANSWIVPTNGFYPNDDEGFAATLFQKGDEKVLAIRGTELDYRLSGDLIKADIGQIGFLGLAMGQAVSMINYIFRLRTKPEDDALQLDWNYSVLIEPGAPCFEVAHGLGYIYLTPKKDTVVKGLGLIEP